MHAASFSSDRPKLKWVIAQVVGVTAFLFFSASMINMLFAIPIDSYIEQYGTLSENLIKCEAVSHPSRPGTPIRCAIFGSVQNHPIVFLGLLIGFSFSVWFLYYSSRPNRGLTSRR